MSNINSWERKQERVRAGIAALKTLSIRFEELIKLNKADQEKILKELGFKKIPKYELDRVIMIIQNEAK